MNKAESNLRVEPKSPINQAEIKEKKTSWFLNRKIASFVNKWNERPNTDSVRGLISHYNFQVSDVLSYSKQKGIQLDGIDTILEELHFMLPFMRDAVDTLANEFPQDSMVFAGRDGELLYDAFKAKFPKKSAVLLPTSGDLLERGDLNGDKGKRFFSTYGISRRTLERALRRHTKFVVVDSGFSGNVGKRMRELVAYEFNLPLDQVTALFPTKLLAHDPAFEIPNTTQINSYDEDNLSISDVRQKLSRGYKPNYQDQEKPRDSIEKVLPISLATALQNFPHHHDSFAAVAKRFVRTIGVPAERHMSDTLGLLPFPESLNQSTVHPIAALILQVATIRYMLGMDI